MGQKSAVDKLPEPLRKRLIELLNRPDVTQLEIVDAINAEAGEPKKIGKPARLRKPTWKSTAATRAINWVK